jgi:hypothetical protein
MAKSPPAKSDERRLFRRLNREELFRLARLRDGEDDEARAHAIHTLHRLYRLYLRRKKAEARTPVSPRQAATVDWPLEDLFKGLGQRIINSNDPAEKARKLFHPPQRRGPKIKNSERDLIIAIEVQKLRISGKTREGAIFAVAERTRLDSEAVRRIVKDQDAAHGGAAAIRLLARSGKTKVGEVKI